MFQWVIEMEIFCSLTDEKKHAQELVAVFKTRLKPSFEIMPW